jgi:AraC family ethanolamine operon transcriptional activator
MDIVGITLDARAFAAFSCASEHHNWEDALRGRPVISAPPAQMAQMRDFLREIFATVEVTPTRLACAAVRVTLRDQILERLCRVLSAADPEPAESFTTAVRRDIVARAREFAAHAPDQPLTVAGLCRALKVSRRTLQICFQEMLAVSPHQYLQALRLNGLRRALQRSDSGVYSVHQAAAQWGFWHLSACAADYKRMFGELPSTTLRTRLQSRVAPR